MTERKYLPTLAELIDRLSISQLKEQFIPEHKEEYAQEIRSHLSIPSTQCSLQRLSCI